MKWIIAYISAAAGFAVLDALWLRWAGPNFYRPAIGELLADRHYEYDDFVAKCTV